MTARSTLLAAALCVAGLGPLALTGLAAPASAQDAGPFGGLKHDSSEPIEIVSDSLEVRQADSIAIFSGQVEAGQGTLRLSADRVVVAYDQDESDSETGAIRSMKADGNVFISNGAETAEGETAEYNVATGMMFLRGNVLLTQGGNAISGPELVIDLNTGRAKMQGGVRGQQGSGGRVKTIFKSTQGQN